MNTLLLKEKPSLVYGNDFMFTYTRFEIDIA